MFLYYRKRKESLFVINTQALGKQQSPGSAPELHQAHTKPFPGKLQMLEEPSSLTMTAERVSQIIYLMQNQPPNSHLSCLRKRNIEFFFKYVVSLGFQGTKRSTLPMPSSP